MNKSFLKFVTDIGPLVIFFFFYYNNDKNLEVAIPPLIVATIISVLIVWILEKKIPMVPLLSGILITLFGGLTIYFKNPISSFFFLGLIGISNGLANVLGSSTWAEIYGVKHIGSIKALTTALMVFSTAFGTALFGMLIDRGFSIEKIALISAIYIFTSLVLLFFIRKRLNPVQI